MNSTQNQTAAKPKLTAVQIGISAWPMVLVAFGGMIGGICGALAWALNMKIMSSSLATPMRYGLCVLTGVAAIGLWLVVVYVIDEGLTM